jgi:hypothetical protein
MKPERIAAIKATSTYGLVGAAVLSVIGNPVAWAVLGFTAYQVGKAAYLKSRDRATLPKPGKGPSLFI